MEGVIFEEEIEGIKHAVKISNIAGEQCGEQCDPVVFYIK